jgi:hypothetical protein
MPWRSVIEPVMIGRWSWENLSGCWGIVIGIVYNLDTNFSGDME